jgi:hypothetical protein
MAAKKQLATRLTVSEGRQLFDRMARLYLRISGDEFIRRWKAGAYAQLDLDEDPRIIQLTMLHPMPRVKRARKLAS